MDSTLLSISLIDANTGQVEGLPKNPRKFSKKEVEKMKKSLSECPEMTDVRPLIVYPHGGRYVVIGGNLRLEGFRALGADDVPCVVLPEDMGVDKLKEITIKDNGSFGAWDFDILDSDWGDLPLEGWGVELFNANNEIEQDMPSCFDDVAKQKPFVLKITFPTANKMISFVDNYKDMLERDYNCIISESGGAL